MAKKPITVRDVAREAGVSTATVSRVVNDFPSVDQGLAERVREAIRSTGFTPNPTGRALRRQISDVWSAIVPDVQNRFFTALLSAIEEVASQNGLSVMLCNTDENLERERQFLATTLSQRMAGVVLAAASTQKSDLSDLVEAKMPTVLVDRRVRSYRGDSVLVDNDEVGRMAAQHLLAAGYRHPAVITGPRHVSTAWDRCQGFRAELADHEVTLSDEMVVISGLRDEKGYHAIDHLLDLPERPDSVFATNGPLTAGVFRAIHHKGLRIPDDLALIGVDDDLWTRMVSPAVTVIEQPVREIGRMAAELLLSRSAEPDRPVTHVVLSATLIERESTRPVR